MEKAVSQVVSNNKAMTHRTHLHERMQHILITIAVIIKIDPSTPENEAKRDLLDEIDMFLRERVSAADKLICKLAAAKIEPGDVVLTYAASSMRTNLASHFLSSSSTQSRSSRASNLLENSQTQASASDITSSLAPHTPSKTPLRSSSARTP
jgi:translation initiation factor 2B subunit (eIF-2B alpha/beta/delta family)